jgi:hypothetical protein
MKFAKVAVAVLACTGLIFAQAATTAAPAVAPVAAPAKAEKPVKKDAPLTIKGTVVSVDAIASTIIVKVKKGEDTLSVESDAKIMSGKKEITLGDLKQDVKVSVTVKKVDGKNVATKIVVIPAAPAKAEKKTEAAPAVAPATVPATVPAAK